MTRRKQVERFVRMVEGIDKNGPPLELGRTGAVIVAAELRALWAREKLLKNILLKMKKHGKSSHLTPQQWAADLLTILKSHDKDNP